jgi:hypothetical protein
MPKTANEAEDDNFIAEPVRIKKETPEIPDATEEYVFDEEDAEYQLELMAAEERAAEIGAEAVFTELLQDHQISPYDLWQDVEARIRSDARFELIFDHKERQRLFEAYCKNNASSSLKKKSPVEDAHAQYQALLREAVKLTTHYDGFCRRYRRDPRFIALKQPHERESQFREYVKVLKKR